jgi:hypothetical protein
MGCLGHHQIACRDPLRFMRFPLEPRPVAVVAELVDAQR